MAQRTYIKLKMTDGAHEDHAGGVYLDAIAAVREFDDDKKGERTVLHVMGHSSDLICINKPLADVEKMLAEAHQQKPEELDWRDISGAMNKPSPKKLRKEFAPK